jgi:hypothetical protein
VAEIFIEVSRTLEKHWERVEAALKAAVVG